MSYIECIYRFRVLKHAPLRGELKQAKYSLQTVGAAQQEANPAISMPTLGALVLYGGRSRPASIASIR